MYIINQLKTVSEEMEMGFYHGTKDFQNLRDQKKDNKMPACYLHLPVRGRFARTKQGFTGGAYSIELMIADKSDLKWDMDQHIPVILAMEQKAHDYMNALLKSGYFKEIGEYVTTEAINVFDINLTGVIVETVITPFDRRSNCG